MEALIFCFLVILTIIAYVRVCDPEFSQSKWEPYSWKHPYK